MALRFALLIITFAVALEGFAQEHVDSSVTARIKEEAYQHSQVMDTLSYLTDVYGPRLSGSLGFYEAAQWAKERLESWGLENVRFDSYRDDLRGWEVQSYSIEMTAPRYMNITALPDAWTRGTDGEVVGSPVIVDHSSLAALQELSGQLRGKLLLSPEFRTKSGNREGIFTEEELALSESRINPTNARGLSADNVKPSIEVIRGRMDRGESEADRINHFLVLASFSGVSSPKLSLPRPMGETRTPVRPRTRYSIPSSPVLDSLILEIHDRLDFVHSTNLVCPFIIDRLCGLNERFSVWIGNIDARFF